MILMNWNLEESWISKRILIVYTPIAISLRTTRSFLLTLVPTTQMKAPMV